MKAKTIQEAVRQTPFKPFFIQVDKGTKVKVAHPECLMFNGRKTECFVAEGLDSIHRLDLEHASGLAWVENGNHGQGRTRSKK